METLLQIQRLNSLGELVLAFMVGALIFSFFMFLVVLFLWLGIDRELRNVQD